MQQVIYDGGADATEADVADALERARKTTLTEFFVNNTYEWGLRHQETDRTSRPRGYDLTYTNYPKYYRWDKKTKSWVRRKKLQRLGHESYIGRMRYVPPTMDALDTFYCRMLLHVVKIPRSCEDL